jgi:hypothetical protein
LYPYGLSHDSVFKCINSEESVAFFRIRSLKFQGFEKGNVENPKFIKSLSEIYQKFPAFCMGFTIVYAKSSYKEDKTQRRK